MLVWHSISTVSHLRINVVHLVVARIKYKQIGVDELQRLEFWDRLPTSLDRSKRIYEHTLDN